jgi:hypothetical protein
MLYENKYTTATITGSDQRGKLLVKAKGPNTDYTHMQRMSSSCDSFFIFANGVASLRLK